MMNATMNEDGRYYIVATEWNYPTETGRDVIADYDTKDEAVRACFNLCNEELDNYWLNCGDYLPPSRFTDDDGVKGVIITAKNGLDDWFFQAKVIEVRFG